MSWREFKTAVAIAVAGVFVSMAPLASAESVDPPSGKYADIDTGVVYQYDAVTGSVTAIPEDVVAEYECGREPWGWGGQCCNCLYVPDGEETWQLATTQYTWGRCVSVDGVTPLALPGHVLMRVDVRVTTTTGDAWYYTIERQHFTCSTVNYSPCWASTQAPVPGATYCTHENGVAYCEGIPRNFNAIEGAPSGTNRHCVWVKLYRVLGEFHRDSNATGCTIQQV